MNSNEGREYIEKVQKGMLARLNKYDADFIESATGKLGDDNFLYSRISSYMKNRAESEYIEKSRHVNLGFLKLEKWGRRYFRNQPSISSWIASGP